MRGRTFLNKFLIIDEAQNLTPKQMKTLITRAGPGTKIVCLGNIAQIDTPYLTEGTLGPDLRGRPLQGLGAQRARHAAARRALAAGRPRGRSSVAGIIQAGGVSPSRPHLSATFRSPSFSGIAMTALVRFVAALLSLLSLRRRRAQFQPQVGQAGKDVIWVPTPDDVVERMLTMAQVTPNDSVWDLGAGDGKIAIMAAKKFGARAIGIEYNPDMVKHANANAQAAGVAGIGQGKATIRHGDIFATDFSSATVITLYLLPALNMKLRPTHPVDAPGTRVVSHSFSMEDWEADEITHPRRPPRLLLDGAGERDGHLEPRARRAEDRRWCSSRSSRTSAARSAWADPRRPARGAPARHRDQLRLRRPDGLRRDFAAASPAPHGRHLPRREGREGSGRARSNSELLVRAVAEGLVRCACSRTARFLRLAQANFTGVNRSPCASRRRTAGASTAAAHHQ